MGKKKRGHPDVEDVLARPWCYYCERDFDDLKILISHQKAKHFKCDRCGRRLNTAGGLSVHMNQVHKEQLGAVENALPNRQGLEVEIFGMEGIPEDVTAAHNQRVLQQFYEQQAERRAATGNPTPGGAAASAVKKQKFESPSDLKKRLAEHRAKKAAEAAGVSSGDNTPLGSTQDAQSPATLANSPGPFPQAGSPHTSQLQPFAGAPQVSLQPAFPPSYGTTAYPPSGFQPPYGAPQSFTPPQPGFSPPGALPYAPPGGLPYMAGQPFPPPAAQGGFPGGPPRQFGPGSPSTYSAPGGGAARQNTLPSPSNLPQRPAFNAPPVNHQQLQQMHHGQVPGLPGSHAMPANGIANANYPSITTGTPDLSTSAAIDELIASATRDISKTQTPPEVAPVQEKEKKAKKDKDKNARLVYSDNEVSPEEKMAQLPRYSFIPSQAGDSGAIQA